MKEFNLRAQEPVAWRTHSSSCQSASAKDRLCPLHLASSVSWSFRRTTCSDSAEGDALEAMKSGLAAFRAWMAEAINLQSQTVTSWRVWAAGEEFWVSERRGSACSIGSRCGIPYQPGWLECSPARWLSGLWQHGTAAPCSSPPGSSAYWCERWSLWLDQCRRTRRRWTESCWERCCRGKKELRLKSAPVWDHLTHHSRAHACFYSLFYLDPVFQGEKINKILVLYRVTQIPAAFQWWKFVGIGCASGTASLFFGLRTLERGGEGGSRQKHSMWEGWERSFRFTRWRVLLLCWF